MMACLIYKAPITNKFLTAYVVIVRHNALDISRCNSIALDQTAAAHIVIFLVMPDIPDILWGKHWMLSPSL